MQAIQNNDHAKAVSDISNALDQLTDALTAEKEAREASLEILPALKFPIKLGSDHHKPFDHVTKWRIWAKASGLLKGGE